MPVYHLTCASDLTQSKRTIRRFENERFEKADAGCLSAWIGLVPKQNSSGGKEKLGSISKAGNRYLRQMLAVGAMAVIRYAERNGTRRPWLVQLMARRTTKVAGCARQQDRPDGLGIDDKR